MNSSSNNERQGHLTKAVPIWTGEAKPSLETSGQEGTLTKPPDAQVHVVTGSDSLIEVHTTVLSQAIERGSDGSRPRSFNFTRYQIGAVQRSSALMAQHGLQNC